MILFFALHLDENNVKHRAPVSFIAKFGSSGARVVSRGGGLGRRARFPGGRPPVPLPRHYIVT